MVKDYLTDVNGDLLIKDGDFVWDESSESHVEDILIANKGDYKLTPLIGVNIKNMVNSPNSLVIRKKLERDISLQLQSDGAKSVVVDYTTTGEINITAQYE
jgi:hypothetical protein